MKKPRVAVMPPDLIALLDRQLACPDCHAVAVWRAAGLAAPRQQSTLQRCACGQCGATVVVKLPWSAHGLADARRLAHDEFRALRELQSAFPQDAAFGTLEPLACLDCEEGAAVVTRAFAGVDLLHCARGRGAEVRHALLLAAGELLRRLHDCSPRGSSMQPIAIDEKLEYLTETYGPELRRDAVARRALDALVAGAEALRGLPVRTAWSHGDFKPENVLCDGRKQVVLDTPLAFDGAVVFDIASFLDHVMLFGRTLAGVRMRNSAAQSNAAFLAGYGLSGAGEMHALGWARLYFMLCYLGRYRKRGGLAGVLGGRRVMPLLRRLAAHLAQVDAAPALHPVDGKAP